MARKGDSNSGDDRRGLDEAEFRSELQTLIRDAHENDITVERHWPCRTEETGPDWEIEIVRVAAHEGDAE